MSTRVKLVLLVITALFITALVMVPRIIEAKRSGAEVVENNATPAANPVQGRRQEVASGISVRNDTSPPIRELKQLSMDTGPKREA